MNVNQLQARPPPACYKLKLVDGGLPSHHTENPFSGADFAAPKICPRKDMVSIIFLGKILQRTALKFTLFYSDEVVVYYPVIQGGVLTLLYYYSNNKLSRAKMLGKNIKKSRQQKKLSQEKLARLTDISLNTLTKIESGFTKRPAIQTIHKIAKVLEVSLDRLMEGDIR